MRIGLFDINLKIHAVYRKDFIDSCRRWNLKSLHNFTDTSLL